MFFYVLCFFVFPKKTTSFLPTPFDWTTSFCPSFWLSTTLVIFLACRDVTMLNNGLLLVLYQFDDDSGKEGKG